MTTRLGFSLIEMAIVLVVIGLLLGGLLTPLSVQIDQQRRQLTQQHLQKIQDALLGYAVLHKRLPCPASCGKFDRLKTDGTICSDAEVGTAKPQGDALCNQLGYLPWRELGVGRYDGWDNSFRYRVEAKYTEGIKAGITSSLRVINKIGDTISDTKNVYLTNKTTDSRVVAIILSGGQNAHRDGDNNENPTPNNLYVTDVGDLKTDIDDILIWLSKHTLASRLSSANNLWP